MPLHAPNPRLETYAADLVRHLGGRWHPGGGMCRCPAHADLTPSLSVRIGHSSLLFKCFAGCSASEIIRAIRRLRLVIPVSEQPSATNVPERDDDMIELVRTIWAETLPITEQQGGAYLAARAIVHRSPDLRFHPRTPLGRGRAVRFRPAIIAAVRDGSGIVAIQRIFLDRDLARPARDLPKSKLTLGRPLAGAVRLHRADNRLGLAEGIETAEAAAALLNIPVWATLGSERLAHVALPDFVSRLILLPDDDAGGRRGMLRAHDAHRRPGRSIETVWPWHRLNDWSDVLMRSARRE